MRIRFGLLFLLMAHLCRAQLLITGQVINAKTKEPLPFVNIGIAGTLRGTTTDFDGRFQIKAGAGDTLIFSYVGFGRLNIAGRNLDGNFQLIELEEKTTDLKEVVVLAGENPAWKIMRKVIANKPKNDPENLSTFSYHCYNKLFGTMIDPNTNPGLPKLDTTKAKKFFENNHLFIFESYTKRYYKKPNQTKEIILGNKMTGVRDPFFTIIATDVQPLSFYTDFFKLFDKIYINPVSKGFEDRYQLVLEDTIIHEQDSVYIISFEPFAGRIFNGLKGQLHISTDGYALQHVVVEPADDYALIAGKVHHVYKKTDVHWFPTQLNTELYFREFGIGQLKLKYISRSYITQVEINKELDNRIFGTLNVEFDDKANFQDSTFWNKNRTDSLSRKDRNTFQVYDSLGPRLNTFNTIFKMVEWLAIGKIKAGPIYFPLPDIVRFNNYEGARLGLGIQTGSRFSKIISLNGYGGYGISDKALKYGAGIQFNLPSRRETFLRFNWSRDLAEPGASHLQKSPLVLGNETLRTWATSRMDSVESLKLELSMRPISYSSIQFSLNKEIRNPTYPYNYSIESTPDSTFTVTEAALTFRYAHGENYTQIRDSKIVTGLAYPQFYLAFSKSFSGVLDGEFDFVKWEAKIDHQFRWRGFGKTLISLQGGVSSGKIPYPYLFNAKGTRFPGSVNNTVVIANYFQTMGLYEFVSDQYAYFFLNHNFGRLVSAEHKVFRPELSAIQNVGYGRLRNPANHDGLLFSTLEKGYFESGLLLNNILRFTYLKLFYLGLGGGAFYRYGPYALPNPTDNFAWKFALSLSF